MDSGECTTTPPFLYLPISKPRLGHDILDCYDLFILHSRYQRLKNCNSEGDRAVPLSQRAREIPLQNAMGFSIDTLPRSSLLTSLPPVIMSGAAIAATSPPRNMKM